MLESLVYNCRSIRSFDESRPVSREALLDLVELARLTASAANKQPLKYYLVTGAKCAEIQPLTAWAAALPDVTLPPEGHMPTGFILICHDTQISPVSEIAAVDVGIAAQTIALSATEKKLGCCMIASFNKTELSAVLGISEQLVPRLLIAVGYPAETAVICEAKNGDTAYFRDDSGLHFVPKRSLSEVTISDTEARDDR